MVNIIRTLSLLLLLVFFSPISVIDSALAVQEPTVDDLLDDEFVEDEAQSEEEIYDPLEPMNRFFFEVNDTLYYWVIKPANRVYSFFLPIEIRDCLGNFFDNLTMPVKLLNNLLQGDFEDAGIVVSRFFINSTLGIFGLGDPATSEFNLVERPADFGQTLGRFGVGEGFYLYWPIIGPSNVRDTIGYLVDTYSHPVPYLSDQFTEELLYYTTDRLNDVSLNPDAYDDIKKYSLDPYIAIRQGYYDYRRTKIKQQSSKETAPIDF